ncbi:hypothetical protein J6590_042365 [Homalodisca vitripennis]|nr:hypothetical protein J6590_042365 [Homalodisca vitripennis]
MELDYEIREWQAEQRDSAERRGHGAGTSGGPVSAVKPPSPTSRRGMRCRGMWRLQPQRPCALHLTILPRSVPVFRTCRMCNKTIRARLGPAAIIVVVSDLILQHGPRSYRSVAEGGGST